MIYFNTKDDLSFIHQFGDIFEKLRKTEISTRENLSARNVKWLTSTAMFRTIREEANKNDLEYAVLRVAFAKMTPRAIQITESQGIRHHRQIKGAPIESDEMFSGSIYTAILNLPFDLVDFDTDFRNTINQVLGSLEWKKEREFRQLVNPLFWLKELFVFIIRLPYMLIRMSGFDVKKIEDHFLGKFFQLLYVIALILLTTRLGISIADAIQILASTKP